MAKFKYTAVDSKTGKRIQDTVNADSKDAANAALRRLGLQVQSLQEEKSLFGGGSGGGKRIPKPRIKSADMVIFTRQFSTMISAGLPVMECLDILGEQAEDPASRPPSTRLV